MFKERFPRNFSAYEAACKAGEIRVGRMFVTETGELERPRWVINFPTKKHWRRPSRLEWIEEGLKDLGRVIREKQIESIAVPPPGCGNGGLDWSEVRPLLAKAAEQFPGTQWIAYEPTAKYQNVAKRQGVEKLTVARALVAEVIRRYSVVGIECTMLEVQKLAWFLERSIQELELANLLDLRFEATGMVRSRRGSIICLTHWMGVAYEATSGFLIADRWMQSRSIMRRGTMSRRSFARARDWNMRRCWIAQKQLSTVFSRRLGWNCSGRWTG
jgi:O-acetyl-ADP-ribose deacetylase (regulator of RNase III)